MKNHNTFRLAASLLLLLLLAAPLFSSCEKITDDDYSTLQSSYRTNGGGNLPRY